MQHVLSARQFEVEELENIFASADRMREANPRELVTSHVGETATTLFYEPSTRTRLSFGAAAVRLGMGLVSTENAREFSSAIKGETLEDTIRTVDKYVDAIVIRHHETGAADAAAAVSRVPIINAGDGQGEHPTQALLDLYTILHGKGRLQDLRVVIGGDLKHGRTARSLAQMVSLYPNNHIDFVSTSELGIGSDISDRLRQRGTSFAETEELFDVIRHADVVYWTRLQKERLGEGEDLQSRFVIDQAALQEMHPEAIIMHPLPRVTEIDASVDEDPRARYFEQVENGLYVRMALFDRLLTATDSSSQN